MRRRDFITLFGGAAAAWPLAARAQQAGMPVIGFLQPASREANADRLRAYRDGLKETGYIEGQNVAIEYRFADGQNDRLPNLATDLVHRQVTVITAMPKLAAVAAKAATSTIPIVFLAADDPVAIGLVSSLNQPGGNVTGLADMNGEITPKRLGILHDLVPKADRYAAMVNPNTLTTADVAEIKASASASGKQIEIFVAGTPADIDLAFADFAQKGVQALLVVPNSFFVDRRAQIVELAKRHALPAIYHDRQFAEAGGLVTYGTNLADQIRQVGIYTGRILKGDKPADLPVLQPTKFDLTINLKTAKSLGLTVPPLLLSLADEVIE
jgi:putative ABC transport system substrate-binding protein